MRTSLNTISTKIVEPARWIVVGLIAYTLATSVLYFVSPPQSDPVSQGPSATVESRQRTTDINDILARNLFGVADSDAAPVERAVTTTATRLPLELHGVFVAEVEAESAAIVAQKGKSGILYTVGQTLPGNAELVEVHPDHIVLRRAGSRETLKFPEFTAQMVSDFEQSSDTGPQALMSPDTSSRASPSSSGEARSDLDSSAESPSAGSVREFVTNYRELIEGDPDSALAELGIAPVSDGASSGYRLGDLADSPYLSQTGLQPGDVILSVNGRPVGDIRNDRMEIDNVLAQGSARLEVQRGTRRFFVTASLQ